MPTYIASLMAGMALFGAAALAWPLAVRPALRRRYERSHFRKKRR